VRFVTEGKVILAEIVFGIKVAFGFPERLANGSGESSAGDRGRLRLRGLPATISAYVVSRDADKIGAVRPVRLTALPVLRETARIEE
jgi:hypothetical protein